VAAGGSCFIVTRRFGGDIKRRAFIKIALVTGGVLGLARQPGDYFLRPPAWAPRAHVSLARGGKEPAVEWGGPALAYVHVKNVKSEEVMTLLYPLVTWKQVVAIWLKPTERKSGKLSSGPEGAEPFEPIRVEKNRFIAVSITNPCMPAAVCRLSEVVVEFPRLLRGCHRPN
jgi:hypothetical protein